MKNNNEALKAVRDIKSMMEKSSHFTSFSGTSAILIGTIALAGAAMAKAILDDTLHLPIAPNSFSLLIALGIGVFLLSLIIVLSFSALKSHKAGQQFASKQMLRTLINFLLPLFVGGLFCASLIAGDEYRLLIPAMLLFYGLALVNASKYTFGSIFWLGCIELLTGTLSLFLSSDYALLFWTIGFGWVHIVYGIYFYFAVERR